MATDLDKVKRLAGEAAYRQLPRAANGCGEAEEINCHDRLRICLTVNQRQIVTEAGYDVTEEACPTLYASAAAAVALALGKPVLAAYAVSHTDIGSLFSDCGTLDIGHVHCAIMAELALKRAVVDYSRRLQAGQALA